MINEVKRRCALASSAISKLCKFWDTKDVDSGTKLRINRACTLNNLPYDLQRAALNKVRSNDNECFNINNENGGAIPCYLCGLEEVFVSLDFVNCRKLTNRMGFLIILLGASRRRM
ncbi:unnamed protein product [Soboliphyme baturini]|uniref:Uncharacterized protein n=1 Tax=Soboliphyme baturini TaxID=241478 RepID=A0A183ITF3_9BILA|nr:unnamed protein product [Soboliphyme baturini]